MARKKSKPAREAKAERSGRISLYVSPERHSELAVIAETLGLDINGLLRLMIARSFEHFRMEAELLMLQAQENVNLLHVWREANPGKPIREFWDEYWTYWHAKNLGARIDAFTGIFDFEKAEEMAARAATKGTHSPEEKRS
jgi:hypothetical protein